MSLFTYQPKEIQVIDGDTLDIVLDLGFHITHKIRVRLKGINAPEMRTEEGKKSKQFVIDWLKKNPLVVVKTFKDKKEKYGRYLATILSDSLGTPTTELNAALVSSGNAVYKDYK